MDRVYSLGTIIHPYLAKNKEFVKSIQDIKKQNIIRDKMRMSPHQILHKMLSSEPIGGGGGGGGSSMHQKTGNSSELAKRVMTQAMEKWKKSLRGKHISDDNPALWIIAPLK